MKLRAVRMFDVRRFGGKGVAIENILDGLNIFAAPNEAGKSTLFDALHALLFSKHTSQTRQIFSLKPYAGGSPLIVADVEFEDRLYRIEKKFLSGPFARVLDVGSDREVARADEAQTWINGMIGSDDGGYGPTGLLWVRQGESSNLNEGTETRKAALGNIVEREVNVLTGGQRMRKILKRCTSELGQLVTPTGRARAGGAYGQSLKTIESLEKELAKLGDRLDNAQDDLETRHNKRKELAGLKDPKRQEENELLLSEARTALEQAQQYAERVGRARSELELAELTLQTAKKEKETFVADYNAAHERKRELESLRGKLPEFQQALDGAVEKEGKAHTVWQDAAKALADAETMLTQSRGAHRAREARQRHQELSETLATVEKANKARQDAHAAAEAIQIETKDIERLNHLEKELTRATSALRATSTTLRMTYDKDYKGHVKLGRISLENNLDIQIDTASTLTFENLGVLSIVPGFGDESHVAKNRLSEVENALNEKLEALDCLNLKDAQVRLSTREALQSEAEKHSVTIAALAPDGIDLLATRLAKLAAKLDDSFPSDVSDVNSAQDVQKKCQAHELRTRDALEALRESRRSAQSGLEIHKGNIDAAATAYEQALSRIGPEVKWQQREESLSKAVADAQAAIAPLRNSLTALEQAPHDLDLARATVSRLEEARDNHGKNVAALERDIAVLDKSLETAANDGVEEAYSEIAGQLQTATQRAHRLELLVAILQRLKAALESASANVRERYLMPVNEELKPLLGLLYGGGQIEFNDDLAPEHLTRNGVVESVDALSGGTREQIAIMTRLAFAKLLARGGRATPIILDDALIFSDDDRIEKMFTTLHAQTKDLQILTFTCRQRAFQTLGGNILALEKWMPQ